MSRMTEALHMLIDKEQTCAIDNLWDNLRDVITFTEDRSFYILALDQKKAFHDISRGYIWCVMRAYGFPEDFLNMVKLLYFKSAVKVNVNRVLTDCFETEV